MGKSSVNDGLSSQVWLLEGNEHANWYENGVMTIPIVAKEVVWRQLRILMTRFIGVLPFE